MKNYPTLVVIEAVSSESIFLTLTHWRAGRLVILNLSKLTARHRKRFSEHLAETSPQEIDPKTWLIAPQNFLISFGAEYGIN